MTLNPAATKIRCATGVESRLPLSSLIEAPRRGKVSSVAHIALHAPSPTALIRVPSSLFGTRTPSLVVKRWTAARQCRTWASNWFAFVASDSLCASERRMTTSHAVVLTTVASYEDARRIAALVLDERLAAAVQMLSINSLYTWKGARVEETEVLLVLMTRKELYERLESAISSLHKYETPEILLLPIGAGLPAYLSWIDEVTEPI